MQAIISDIHGNLEALEAVLEDIEGQKVDEILCLGDVVGYGPNPVECLDIAMEKFKWVLMGNHEWALINQPVGFSPAAKAAIEITRRIFEEAEDDEETKQKRMDFISGLEPIQEDSILMFVHGSPKDPIMDYVFPEQFSRFWSEDRVDELLKDVRWACFCGHSHIPCIISSAYDSIVPLEDVEKHELDRDMRYIINSGAVGQPRDRNPKASYLILDRRKVTFRRVEYDHETTAAKIRELGFDEKLATRLAEGT